MASPGDASIIRREAKLLRSGIFAIMHEVRICFGWREEIATFCDKEYWGIEVLMEAIAKNPRYLVSR